MSTCDVSEAGECNAPQGACLFVNESPGHQSVQTRSFVLPSPKLGGGSRMYPSSTLFTPRQHNCNSALSPHLQEEERQSAQ